MLGTGRKLSAKNSDMAQVDAHDPNSRADRSRILIGIYAGLTFVAGACGVALGVAGIVDASDNMFFIPALVFFLLVPVVCGIGLAGLGLAASRGSRWSFYASWLFAVVLLIPACAFVYLLVLRRQPESFLESFPQMGQGEIIALASLVAAAICLVAVVVVGFQVWAKSRRIY